MRILFVLHTYLPEGRGGTEVHVQALAKRLLRANHAVRVVCREGDPKKPNYAVTREAYEGVEIVRINHLYEWPADFEATYKSGPVHEVFERELVLFKPDVVHIHHLTGLSTTIVETIKAGGTPLVMTLHDFWTICPRGQRIKKELEICEDVDRNICFHCLGGIWPHLFHDREAHRTELDSRGRLAPKPLAEFDRHLEYILNLADVLIAPSAFHRERMLDFPIDADRIVALPHGLDPAPFRRIDRKRRPVRKIGFIGSVIPIKGPHVLIDAFRHLARPDFELHIHGEAFAFHGEKDYLERLKSRAIGLRGVFFHGAYLPADLPKILADLDVLVVPSLWWESFCLTIREGQLAGVPVIASDLGAMREALDGEDAGLLFHPGDARDLAEKIDRIARDDELRARLSDVRDAVKTLDEYVPEIMALYQRAQAVSAERAGTLVVAPPSFPAPPAEVQVSWSLPDDTPFLVGAVERPSERQLRFVLTDKANGHVLGEVTVGAPGTAPVVVVPKVPGPPPSPSGASRSPGTPWPASASPGPPPSPSGASRSPGTPWPASAGTGMGPPASASPGPPASAGSPAATEEEHGHARGVHAHGHQPKARRTRRQRRERRHRPT